MNPFWKRLQSCSAGLALALTLNCAGEQTSIPFPAPDIALSLDQASLTVAPDTLGLFTATVRPIDGYSGKVALSVDAQGLDVTASVIPSTFTMGTDPIVAKISVAVAGWATAGEHALTFHARGNFEAKDLSFKVSVPAARLLPVFTYVNFTQANLPFMAFKDGDAPWRVLEGNEGAYQAAVTDQAGRYGLAYGYDCGIGSFHSFQMNYIFQTMQESSSLGVYFICNPSSGGGPDPVLYSLQGRIRGQGTASGYLVTSAATIPFAGSDKSYLTKVLKGRGDLAGWIFSDLDTHLPTRLFLDRGRDAQGDTVRDVDFAADGFDPGPLQPISYSPIGSDEVIQGIVRYFTSGGQYFGLGDGTALPSYAAFPSKKSESGDSYGYGFGAFGLNHEESIYGGSQGLPGPLSITFPTPIPPFQVDWLPGPYRRPGISWSSVTPLPRLQQFALSQNINQEQVYWYLLFSEGWLGAGVHNVQIPDFTGFAGWDERWGFRTGKSVNVDHGQFGSIGGGVAGVVGTEKASAMMSTYLSSAGGLMRFQALGQQHGAFRVVGLAATPSVQPVNSYSATRQMVTTP